MLADFCFADLLLYVPDAATGSWLVVGQVRPATGQTIYHDRLGRRVGRPTTEVPLLREGARVRRHRARARSTSRAWPSRRSMLAIPVRVRRARSIAVLTREWSQPHRPPARRARAHLPVDLRTVRGDDRRGHRSRSHGARGRFQRRAACRRRRDGARRRRPGAVRLAERHVAPCTASASAPTPSGMRLAELGFNDGPVRQAFERRRAGHRGVRPDARRHAADPLPADPGRRRRSPAGCCCCATSPSCASATGCCCRRTPRSARSTTG